MLLAVDIGNTQTSFGIFEKQTLRHHFRFDTKRARSCDEYAALLFPLLHNAGISEKQFTGIALCSVVPPCDFALKEFCHQYLHQSCFRIGHPIKLGFELNVDFPQEVGADRLSNTAYAVEHLRLPAVVIDFGTATTFDVISIEKTYEGGLILPGVQISVEALISRTSKLPSVDLKFPENVIGKNTITCIQSGILYGYCDQVRGLLQRVFEEVGKPCDVAITGGVGFLFQGRLASGVGENGFSHASLSCETKFLPDLTLEGIRILFERNR